MASQLFFTTPQQRLQLARQRYFEEGLRPSGLVSEPVIQSWSRCLRARRDPAERIAFNPVTTSRVHSALARAQLLLQAASTDLDRLEQTLAGTTCTALLTDAQGVVVHASRSSAHEPQRLLPLARRVGVSLDEHHVGTGAPGVALHTGQPCVVLGAEHFFSHLQVLQCAAAPIRDIHGRIAAVLDVTTESQPFGFDAAALVGMHATAIENALLRAQSGQHLVVQLQSTPALLDTPMEGLAGVDSAGDLVWVNPVAARLLGVAHGPCRLPAADVFGLQAHEIVRLSSPAAATAHRLPNGLTVWLAVRLQARDGLSSLYALAAPAAAVPGPSCGPLPTTLRDGERDLIERTVQACAGNVSKAARTLGVSRGLVYRHLRRSRHP